MARASHPIGLVAITLLLLPAPGTTSRERRFCGEWLRLPGAERAAVLRDAEAGEADGPWGPQCRAGLQRTLDAECRNWRALMDFEVRLVVDRVLEDCGR
jgi:hypothetical protein